VILGRLGMADGQISAFLTRETRLIREVKVSDMKMAEGRGCAMRTFRYMRRKDANCVFW